MKAPGRRRILGSGRLRVALLSPSLIHGGAERQMLILASALPRDVFDLRFILIAERGPLAVEADALGIPVHVLGLRAVDCRAPSPACLGKMLRASRRYLRLTRDVDVVDAWLVPAITLAGLARPFARVPVVIAGRRSLAAVARPRSRIRRAAATLAMRRADAVVANSAAAARELVDIDGIDPGCIRVIANAVVAAPVEPDARERIRGAWGLGASELVVGCVANYKPGKGLASLLAAAAELRDRLPHLRYVLVGEGPLRDSLTREIRERGQGSTVILHGATRDARMLYPAFDIVVQTSESEGSPNAVLEAAAAGRPIVATAVGGTAEIITAGRDGLLVPPADPAALASAIAELAQNPARRRELGRAAEERARAFSASALAEARGRLYLELAGRTGR